MHRWLAALLFAACLMAGQGAYALGLGEITTRSALNEPMDAEIALLGATPDELTTLEVRLASRETFDRYGIDKPTFVSKFQFKLRRGPNPAVLITSVQPVTEPFVTMLVEAVWPRGRLLREYTVLLDPPTYAAPAAQSSPAPVRQAPAAQRETRSSGAVRRAATAAPLPRLEGDQYRVQRNDTLWEIAQRIQPDESVSINQVMVAIYEANPQAFDGNINRLNAGAVLRLPDAETLYSINRSAATQEVQRQMRDWRGGSGALVLTPPDDDTVAGTGAPTGSSASASGQAGAGTASSAEMARLRQELAERERQLQIRNEELARLQQQLAEQQAAGEAAIEAPVSTQDLYTDEAADETGADEAVADAADGVFAEDDDVPSAADVAPADDVVDPDDAEAETPAATRPPPAVVTTSRPEPSLIEKLTGSIYTWVAAGVVLVIGLLAFLVRRRGADDDPTGTWEALDSADLEDLDGTLAATGRLRDIGTTQRADTSRTSEQRAIDRTDSFEATAPVDEVEPPAAHGSTAASDVDTSAGYSLDDTFSSETAINLDQSDPLAEADFHMAYGLYDQAAELVKGALKVDPSDKKLKAKLAEIYFVWGNQDGFVAAAEDLKSSVAESDPEWNKVVIMGQQIAPAHALFSGAVASSEGGDLDLSLDETRASAASIDAELGGDDDGFGEVFETAADLGDDDGGTVEHVAADISGIDFEFDESMLPEDDAGGDNNSDTSASGIDFEFDGESLADGTVEQPVDFGAVGDDDATAETAEVDVSELDLDLDTGDATASMRDAADDISDDLLEATGVTSVLPDDFKVSLPDAPSADDDTVLADTSSFDDRTLEMDGDGDATREMPAFDETGTAESTAIRPAGAIGDVDFDVADLTSELSVDDLGADATRELDKPDASPTLFSEEVFAGDEDVDSDADTGLNLALDAEETGNTNVAEVGTKLDLARAYVVMGDPEGARSILDEVINEGDAEQQAEARKLLESLG